MTRWRPEGAVPSLILPDHALAQSRRSQPPRLLGYNQVTAKPNAQVVAVVGAGRADRYRRPRRRALSRLDE